MDYIIRLLCGCLLNIYVAYIYNPNVYSYLYNFYELNSSYVCIVPSRAGFNTDLLGICLWTIRLLNFDTFYGAANFSFTQGCQLSKTSPSSKFLVIM